MSPEAKALADEITQAVVTVKKLTDMLNFMQQFQPLATKREFALAGCCSQEEADELASLFVEKGLFRQTSGPIKAYLITKIGLKFKIFQIPKAFGLPEAEMEFPNYLLEQKSRPEAIPA